VLRLSRAALLLVWVTVPGIGRAMPRRPTTPTRHAWLVRVVEATGQRRSCLLDRRLPSGRIPARRRRHEA